VPVSRSKNFSLMNISIQLVPIRSETKCHSVLDISCALSVRDSAFKSCSGDCLS
jgi:hypothetical protein